MIGVYGTNLRTKKLCDSLQEMGKEICSVAEYNANFCEDDNAIKIEDAVTRYKHHDIDRFLIPTGNEAWGVRLVRKFVKLGVNIEDIYCTQRSDPYRYATELIPYLDTPYMPYLEYHIADHCNLNCKYCEHYAALVQEPFYHDFDKVEKDLEQLHRYISDIKLIRIMGGEPLLHPELVKFAIATRELYPLARIRIVTNGIKLFSLEDHVFNALREYDIGFTVSLYPPMAEKVDDFRALFEKHRMIYGISKVMDVFTVKQSLEEEEDIEEVFDQCFQSECHNLYQGKLGICFLPFTTKYFNDYFNTDLPMNEALDLYDSNLSTRKIKEAMMTPISRCAYCVRPKDKKWDIVKTPSMLEDWVN